MCLFDVQAISVMEIYIYSDQEGKKIVKKANAVHENALNERHLKVLSPFFICSVALLK